jgi:hypothetical protein
LLPSSIFFLPSSLFPEERAMGAGRWSPFTFCLLLCGCLGRNHVDPDYRFREGHLAELREQLYSGEFGAATRHREDTRNSEGIHQSAYHQATAPSSAQRLVLTAAPEGEHGGALRVVVELRDPAGRSLRVPASLHLTVLQAGPGPQQTFLGDWDLPNELLEHAWTGDWSGGGYRLLLPWKTWPSTPQVRVQARLTLADGTHYEAEQELPLRAAAAAPVLQQVQGQAAAEEPPPVRTAGLRWQPTSLEGAMKLGRPVHLTEGE